MANPGRKAVEELTEALKAEGGLERLCADLANAAGVELVCIDASRVADSHIAAELAEKGAGVKYPMAYVYCDRVTNSLTEKFRTFSGTADLSIEIRISHDHAEQLQQQLHVYIDAVTKVIDTKRGQWSGGVFYTGGYEVSISPVKRGGKNYLQTARVKLQVHASTV
jgi:hypothetical protein